MKFQRYTFMLLTIAFAAHLVGCGKKADSALTTQSASADATDVGLNVIGSAMDDASGEVDTGSGSGVTALGIIATQSLPPVCYARAVSASCNAGNKTAEYASCRLPFSHALLSGSVSLAFSDNSCSMDTVGNSVTRTKDLVFTGYFGGKLHRFSSNQQDYLGDEIGGGSVLTHTSGGYSLNILGIHEEIEGPAGTPLRDVSVKTVSPLQFQGGLLRKDRRLVSGSLEVDHNLAKFTATYAANNLTWSADCCYPTGGSMSVAYTGSISGQGSVTFNSCGKVTITRDGASSDVQLSDCE